MTSVTAFNEMMGQFIDELQQTFPEEKGLKKCRSAFDLMKDTNPRSVSYTHLTLPTIYTV